MSKVFRISTFKFRNFSDLFYLLYLLLAFSVTCCLFVFSVGVPFQESNRAGEAYIAVDNPLPNPENISTTDTTKAQKKFEGKTEQRSNDLEQKLQAVSQI